MSKFRENLFKRHSKPPDRLVEEVQRSATEQGWMPPWTLEEQREKEQRKKQKAGKKSVAARRQRARLRLRIVQRIWEQLDTKYKCAPYSADTVNAVCEKYFVFVFKRAASDDSRRLPRTPLTEDELRSFALDVEYISQLPEEDRAGAVQDEIDAFLKSSSTAYQKGDRRDCKSAGQF